MALSAPIAFLDFEGCTRTGIVEYGIALWERGEIKSVETALCAPRESLNLADTRLHGLRERDLVGAESIEVFWELFSSLRQKAPFAAHHHIVENMLLHQAWPHGRKFPDFASGGLTLGWGPWIDTRLIFELLYPDLGSYKLMDLIETFQLSAKLKVYGEDLCPASRCRPHCALYDAIASALLFEYVSGLPELSAWSLADWIRQPAKMDDEQLELF
ncbi:MAG: 3'-5' exonuclease [Opitutales bacterium]